MPQQEIVLIEQKTSFLCLCCYEHKMNNAHFAHHCAKTYRIFSEASFFIINFKICLFRAILIKNDFNFNFNNLF